ncbi:winged helix-turn-helix domain-containing protein [Salmonella enterica]|uniref:Winged helix-turn-helix domain-containing protein n=2 Tax=Salmonella enterica TaxID=28901 RepID=A0A5T2QTZ2_SALER|nr:winged helix-turn-helix domain-containing protein [Salmonella enterica subsp. enterica serovar Pomona]EAA8398527.1 winged helix-turn-helix domain-containing protein [Salmonella enterica subsp. enterica serovar Oranienburg]EAB4095443.1 winged helix-turn-helix domain-containing protein [Salmonella enterica]EAC2152227.1 winged helix-turn-helix domain-containing protein [Salmonella enterica subsp. enterica]EAM4339224.1 winged helix-turn-helix domain-containing protein [Salmonella enterica subsp.
MTIFEYLQDHPDSTSSEIAKALNKKTSAVASTLSHLRATGRVVKSSRPNSDTPVYRVNELPFGCSNRLTMMFNHLLREVRR